MIGTRIRYYRKLKGYTLETLSEGICSVSYLSKIENGGHSSDDILIHLCERLGISFSEVDDSGKIEEIKWLIDDWYRMIVNYEDPRSLEERAKEIEDKLKQSSIQQPLIHLRFDVFKLRYEIYRADLKESKRLIQHLNQFKEILDTELQYYFHHFSGIYYNMMNDYTNAIKYLKMAEEELKKISHSETEEAHLNYQFANLYCKFQRLSDCMNYAEKALATFNKDYNITRISDCQTILGITNREIKNYSKAEYHYGQALKFAKVMNDPVRLGVIYHNLGFVKSDQGASEEAISCYQRSLEYKEKVGKNESIILTVYLLAKEYHRLSMKKECLEQIERGLEISKTIKDKRCYYLLSILKFDALDIKDETYEHFILNEALPYFEKNKTWDFVAMYAEDLGNYYFKLKFYKKAGEMYQLANEARKKIR